MARCIGSGVCVRSNLRFFYRIRPLRAEKERHETSVDAVGCRVSGRSCPEADHPLRGFPRNVFLAGVPTALPCRGDTGRVPDPGPEVRPPLPGRLSPPLAGSEKFGTGVTGGTPAFSVSVRRGPDRTGRFRPSMYRFSGCDGRVGRLVAGPLFGPVPERLRRGHGIAARRARDGLVSGHRCTVLPMCRRADRLQNKVCRERRRFSLFAFRPSASPFPRTAGPRSAERQRDEGMPTLCSSMSISSASRYLTTVTLFSAAMSVWRRTFTS